MIIECFGVPGSGKSRLASELASAYGYATVPAYVGRWQAVLFAGRHPVFIAQWVAALLTECAGTGTWSLARYKLAVFSNTIGRFRYAQKHFPRHSVVVLDEGILQRMLSLYERKRPDQLFASWLTAMPHADLVVAVDLTTEDASRKRGTRRTQQGAEYMEQWQGTILHNYEVLRTAVEHSGMRHHRYVRENGGAEALRASVSLCNKGQ